MEETAGAEGSGVYMYRNLFNKDGEAAPRNLVGTNKNGRNVESQTAGCGPATAAEKKSAMATAMSSSRNLEARRRLSQSAQLRANLPLLAEG